VLSLLAATVVAAGQPFTCTPTRVWDGDGPVWCAEGPRLRIAGIAAREMDGTCRSHHPCPRSSAIAARDALVKILGGSRGTTSTGHVLVRGPKLTCRSDGPAEGNRTAAWCRLPSGADLSCTMIHTRTVLRWDRYWKGPACR
jgi:endonuclease YncB( thermonuclease family)